MMRKHGDEKYIIQSFPQLYLQMTSRGLDDDDNDDGHAVHFSLKNT